MLKNISYCQVNFLQFRKYQQNVNAFTDVDTFDLKTLLFLLQLPIFSSQDSSKTEKTYTSFVGMQDLLLRVDPILVNSITLVWWKKLVCNAYWTGTDDVSLNFKTTGIFQLFLA